MKQGRRDNTVVFGTDSELYVSRLFMMMKNPNGGRRPDLVSVSDHSSPRLTLEVKSGREKKGVLNEEQLHYAITTKKDYVEVFKEEMRLGTLFGETKVKVRDPK